MAHRKILLENKKHIAFFKIGGTWDMVKQNGKLIGLGGLDDSQIAEIETSLIESTDLEKTLQEREQDIFRKVKDYVSEEVQKPTGIIPYISWVPHINTYVKGEFYSLFSGDSSHLRSSLVAPFVSALLSFANNNPNIQILGAQGTDTADLAIIPLLDAFLFDTELLPMLFTGANRSHYEWNSDAPKNFSDLFQLAGAHLPAGCYWIFASHLYRASDMVKIDPGEIRRIENYTTFFAPRLTSRHTKKVIGENALFNFESNSPVSNEHPISSLTAEALFAVLNQITTVDLGNQNPVEDDIMSIQDSNKKAVIIAAHSFGNASNPIRQAATNAANAGKLVVVVDKSLLGSVTQRYAAGILEANEKNLLNSQQIIISGHRMNKAIAHALVARALIENFGQQQTQKLILTYCQSRQLIE